MSVESMSQERMVKDLEITVRIYNPHLRVLDEIEIYLTDTLNKIQACLEES